MARAVRTVLAVMAALGALALVPSSVPAVVVGTTDVDITPTVTVGDTDVLVTITLGNANEDPDDGTANTLCAFEGVSSPCMDKGTTLEPACSSFTMLMGCGLDADPNVFDAPTTAAGRTGSACEGVTFDVAEDSQSGKLSLTPQSPVLVGGSNGSCIIDIVLSVTGMPAVDSSSDTDGVQTDQVAEATQYIAFDAHTSQASSGTTVEKAETNIQTTASPGVVLGGTLTATATVSGRVNPTPGGDVDFTLFGPEGVPCQPPPAHTVTVPLAADGTATTPPFAPLTPGTYRWVASYSGDDNNASAFGGCGDPVVVNAPVIPPMPPPPPPPLATPSIGVAASPGVVVGGQVTATATVAGRRDPAGSTVLFRAYGPEGTGCLDPPTFSATAAVGASGVVTSPPFTPPVAGLYRWVATYNGDANNAPAQTACNAAGASVTIAPLPPQIISAGFVEQPRVGEPAFLTIAAYDPTGPISGVQVKFGEPSGLEGLSACREPGDFGVAFSPLRIQVPYTFTTPGRHTITIVFLTGGCDGPFKRTEETIEVVVAGGQATRQGFAAAPSPQVARAAAVACPNRFLTPRADPRNRAKVAAAILCLINIERRKVGLKLVKKSPRLSLAATGHSKDMLKRRYFQHAGPGGPPFTTRLRKIKYRGRSAAENIGYGSKFNADLMVKAWMNSPPHKANILFAGSHFAGQGIVVGIPVTPSRPGSTYTMVFGSAIK